MTRWRASVLAILLASFPGLVSAQVDCDAVPRGPARTDCYAGLSRVYRGQSDVAAGNARMQSDAARLQQVTGTRNHSKASKHRRKKLPQLVRNKVADRSGQGSSAAPSGRGPITGARDAADLMADVTKAVATRYITPGEAAEIGKMIDTYLKAYQTAELDERVARVEQLSDTDLIHIAVGGLQTEVTRPPQLTKLLPPNSR